MIKSLVGSQTARSHLSTDGRSKFFFDQFIFQTNQPPSPERLGKPMSKSQMELNYDCFTSLSSTMKGGGRLKSQSFSMPYSQGNI